MRCFLSVLFSCSCCLVFLDWGRRLVFRSPDLVSTEKRIVTNKCCSPTDNVDDEMLLAFGGILIDGGQTQMKTYP